MQTNTQHTDEEDMHSSPASCSSSEGGGNGGPSSALFVELEEQLRALELLPTSQGQADADHTAVVTAHAHAIHQCCGRLRVQLQEHEKHVAAARTSARVQDDADDEEREATSARCLSAAKRLWRWMDVQIARERHSTVAHQQHATFQYARDVEAALRHSGYELTRLGHAALRPSQQQLQPPSTANTAAASAAQTILTASEVLEQLGRVLSTLEATGGQTHDATFACAQPARRLKCLCSSTDVACSLCMQLLTQISAH
jgi:hypothetical protein